MQKNKFKIQSLAFFLLLMLSSVYASNCIILDGYSNIPTKEGHVQGSPKGSSIQMTLSGHVLSIVFLENLGNVSIEVSNLNGAVVQTTNTPTPHGVDMYISNTGSYIVTFTLSNGDEYYGEFEVTD